MSGNKRKTRAGRTRPRNPLVVACRQRPGGAHRDRRARPRRRLGLRWIDEYFGDS